MPQLFSPKERDNLDRYDKFMNEFSVRFEGGWLPPNTIPYNEVLLRHTLGLSPRVKSNEEFYPDSDQILRRNRFTIQSVFNKKIESDKNSISTSTTKRELQSSDRGNGRQFSDYKELPFEQGLPLKEDNKPKTSNHDREIFMAIL